MVKITYVTPKDSIEIQNELVTWLQANLTDPYEKATSKTRDSFVRGDDLEQLGYPPKLHISMSDFVPNKIAGQSKTTFLEEEEHHFMIYYYNQKGHQYTFSDNSLKLKDEAQCRKYLQYVRDTLKANMTAFNGYFHKPTFGIIPQPKFNAGIKAFWSVLPFTVFTYRR